MLDLPTRFEPFLRPMVWGGRRLADVLGKPLPAGERIGESWELSDHALHPSVVLDGPHSGRTLFDLLAEDATSILGSTYSDASFPWLIKYLDANDRLSVQVHPNDEQAEHFRPGENGKTEAWFVLYAEPGSRIYAGLREGVDEPTLRRAARDGTIADCLRSFSPRPGDCIHLPAGTVHAVGGGVVFAEVQQTSDVTFRLFDWNRTDSEGRSRELHLEESLACIDWESRPTPKLVADFDKAGSPTREVLATCPYFEMAYRREAGPFAFGGSGSLQAWLILHGETSVDIDEDVNEYRRGDTILLPAATPGLTCVPGESGLVFLEVSRPEEGAV